MPRARPTASHPLKADAVSDRSPLFAGQERVIRRKSAPPDFRLGFAPTIWGRAPSRGFGDDRMIRTTVLALALPLALSVGLTGAAVANPSTTDPAKEIG